jgi:hypothetical protein
VQCEFIDFFSLFVAHVGNNPCINQVCTKMKFICMWLCFNHQDLLRTTLVSLLQSYHKVCVWYVQIIPRFNCLYSYHNAFEMEACSLDLNTPNVDYLCFDSLGFPIFWATHLQSNGEKIQMTQEIFTTIVNDTKAFGFII